MRIRIPPRWSLPERIATSESAFQDRRAFLRTMGGGLAAAGLLTSDSASASASPAARPPGPAKAAAGYPARRNEAYVLDRPLTAELVAARHNVFDEFTVERDKVWKLATTLKTNPWTVHFGGLVEKAVTLDVEELVRRLGLEERLYRHRCVEGWAMAVPWTGFPLRKLVELAAPLAKARFVRMVSFARPEQAPGWNAGRRVFPYYEALSLPEANHELAFLATGIYGHPLPNQHGAPLRLVVPWKYGLKGIKSIVAFQFTEQRPGTFWNELAPGHYSFESNVDPTSPSQAEEEMIGTGEKRRTLPYNGYGDLVAALYA